MAETVISTKDNLDSQFSFYVEKAEASNENGDLIISGVASSTLVDHDSERMSLSALQQMANKINSEGVPLRIEHQKDDQAVVGEVISAEVDPRNRLLIKAKVSKGNAAGLMLHNALMGGLKMGFSVGGRVKRAYRELSEGSGQLVKTFYDILLDEVSVTPRPANYDSWSDGKYGMLAKSINPDALYRQFLTENPKLDYLAVIEKSIPDTAWEKVETKNENTNMRKTTTEEEKKAFPTSSEEEKAESSTMEEKAFPTSSEEEKAESSETEEEKAESSETEEEKAETSETKTASIEYVDSKFNEVISLLKSVQKEVSGNTQSESVKPNKPVEQTNPDEDVTDHEVKPKSMKTRKTWPTETEEKADQGDGNGTEAAEGKKLSPGDAMDQNDSDEKKPDPEKTRKTWPTKDEESEEKAESDEESEEKAEDDEESEEKKESESYGDEYKLDSIARAMKKSGNMSNIDAFVAYVTKTIEDMKDTLKAHNKRVLGLEKSIVETIRQDENIQKSIKVWMKEPGAKKSVSLGVPYAVTKEGMRLRLVPEDFTMVEKSTSGKKADFKSMWGSNFVSKDVE
jgi:hypothetical protein